MSQVQTVIQWLRQRLRTIRIDTRSRYIDFKTHKRSRKWRLVWRSPSGDEHTSREAFPERR